MTTAPLLVLVTHLGSNTALSRLDTLEIGKAFQVPDLKLFCLGAVMGRDDYRDGYTVDLSLLVPTGINVC